MYSVMIVEDDPMVAMINEQYVCKNPDFFIEGTCNNGQEALDFLQTHKVDLIVLDVFMPVMNGIETLKKIREKKISSEVIMVTAANDTTTLEETMYLGVVDYLIKPFAFERFQIALTKFISKRTTLKQSEKINQESIDSLLLNNIEKIQPGQKTYPKGIQENTLNLMKQYFEENSGWQSCDMICEKLKISIVTVRHYLTYMVKEKQILESVNYSTGGRPSMLYKKP